MIWKFQAKLFLENERLELEACIPVFHQWIRDKKIPDELLVDVADYSHVHNGPGVVLIGHQADYYVEEQRGRLGFRYSRKRDGEGSLEEQMRDVLQKTLRGAALLAQEPSLGLRFSTSELLFAVNDRLNAPDTAATHQKLWPALARTTSALWGSEPTAKPESPSPGYYAQTLAFSNAPALAQLFKIS